MKIYILRDNEFMSENVIFGAFTHQEDAQREKNLLVSRWVDEILADDPAQTGVTVDDRKWLIKETEKTLVIEEVELC